MNDFFIINGRVHSSLKCDCQLNHFDAMYCGFAQLIRVWFAIYFRFAKLPRVWFFSCLATRLEYLLVINWRVSWVINAVLKEWKELTCFELIQNTDIIQCLWCKKNIFNVWFVLGWPYMVDRTLKSKKNNTSSSSSCLDFLSAVSPFRLEDKMAHAAGV